VQLGLWLLMFLGQYFPSEHQEDTVTPQQTQILNETAVETSKSHFLYSWKANYFSCKRGIIVSCGNMQGCPHQSISYFHQDINANE